MILLFCLLLLTATGHAHERVDNPFGEPSATAEQHESGYPSYAATTFHSRDYSLLKPYSGNYWKYQGNAMLTPSFVRLTKDAKSQKGSAWNTKPVQSSNWEMHVNLRITGSTKSLFGDGMAIWYVRNPLVPGPVFGSADHFSGLAVIVDTYSNHNGPHNHEHPYISAMINNGSKSYDHDKDGTHTMLGTGCHAKLRNKKHDTVIAIRYEADTLTVSTDVKDEGKFQVCLRETGVILPTGYYIGVSATTGDLSDNHDLVHVTFYDLDETKVDKDVHVTPSRAHLIPSAREQSQQPERSHSPDDPSKKPMSGIRIVLYIFGFAILALVVAGGGFWYYWSNHDRRRKRFY